LIDRRTALVAMPLMCADCERVNAADMTRPKRVGILAMDEDSQSPPREERRFWKDLQRHGWVLGKNLLVEPAYANWQLDRLPELAEALVRKDVDIILSTGPDATVAAARATKRIPVVFDLIFWPLEQGLIRDFAKPGGNVTGTMFHGGLDATIKRLEFLREAAPLARRLSWIWGADFFQFATVVGRRHNMIPELEAATKGLGFETRFHSVSTPKEVEMAFKDIVAWGGQALQVGGFQVAQAMKQTAETAFKLRLASASPWREWVGASGLLSYGVPDTESEVQYERFLLVIDRVLRGVSPSDIPVEMPRRYELVINQRTASAFGLKLPNSLVIRADEVIR
jgi:putative ABC transport system substrate-binding protein